MDNNFKNAKNEFAKIFAKNQKKETMPNKINELVINDIKVNLDSIHAVKGETHKATLLLESNRQIGEHSKTKDISNIFDFLVGRFNRELTSNKEVNNALKLSYVGISRATHLVAVAVNKENLNDYENQMQLAISQGWEIVEV